MTKSKKITLVAAIIVIIALLVVAKVTGGAIAPATDCDKCGAIACATHIGSLWALLPPVIAIGLALITKEVYSSLFIGILSGALLYTDFSFTGTVNTIINEGLINAVTGTAGIFVFLVELGIIVAIINRAGGSAAFGRWAAKNVKSRVGVQLATIALGVLIFVDDYFNCLTVGSVMRPVTDSHKVSRAKLSYLIDATAAPICMIAPISSWAAAVVDYFDGEEGFEYFIKAIPFNFYSLLTIVFMIALVVMKLDYGPMKLHEYNAQVNGDLYTSGDKNEIADEPASQSKNNLLDLIFPIITLIACCITALVYVGFQNGAENVVKAFAKTDATVGLPWGGLLALVVTVAYVLIRRCISFKDTMACIPQGFVAMVPAILILTFATALKNMTSMLGAANYVGEMMSGREALGSFLPAIVFLVACVIAFATGTSWGTFGILIPIVIEVFAHDNTLMVIAMSACLAGAVCGDHCSPISDTTIMSSAGGQCNHINHVSTQMPYAITVAAISFVMFAIAGALNNVLGYGANATVCIAVGTVLTVGTLFIIKLITKKQKIK